MPITRHGPVHNMDTNEPLIMRAPTQRFTRAQARRLLKIHNVKTDPSATMEHLLYLIQMHSVQPQMVPPGKIGKDDPKGDNVVSFRKKAAHTGLVDGFPNNVPKLRKLCKERGVKFKREDNKKTLIQRLREHGQDSA